jgi:hypothetical protein
MSKDQDGCRALENHETSGKFSELVNSQVSGFYKAQTSRESTASQKFLTIRLTTGFFEPYLSNVLPTTMPSSTLGEFLFEINSGSFTGNDICIAVGPVIRRGRQHSTGL